MSRPDQSDELFDIAVEAYTYFYPLVIMDVTRRQATNAEVGKFPGRGPANTLVHMRKFPEAGFRDVVRPNFDTLYSAAWLDLSDGPLVLHFPDTAGRYYMAPMLDMWTDVFASPGRRTTGTGEGDFAVLPPHWTGSLPEGLEVIEAPTRYVWLIGQILTNGPGDYGAVNAVQDGFALTPLQRPGRAPEPATPLVFDDSVDMSTSPVEQVNRMHGAEFFTYAAELLRVHPPHMTDFSQVMRLRRIGLVAGEVFDPDAISPDAAVDLNRAAEVACRRIADSAATLGTPLNGWRVHTDTIGVYGNAYLKRALIAMIGLGAAPPEDAVYPLAVTDADGRPLTGENRYVLHFDADQLPPVSGFWSLTMYDAAGFQIANPLDRFALGDRDPITYNPDGSLDLYLQKEPPAAELASNWLPAPDGPLGVTMRLYSPLPAVLDGAWTPPALHRVDAPSNRPASAR